MRNAARFMSALLIATLLLPSLLAGPAAASGLTTHFAITGLADPIVAGAPDSITVNALDAGDGIDTTFTGTVSFTSSDGSAQLPADGQSLTNGTGTFQVEFRTSGSQSVTVTEDGDTPTGSANTTVDAAALDHLVLSPPNSSKAPGVAQAYTAEGFDQFDNSLGDATGATTFTVATGTCTLADCSSTVAGAHTVTGTDGTATGTATLTVTAGALDHLVLSPATATKAPGVSQAYTAEGRDAFENTLGDVTGATTFTVATGTCTLADCSSTVAGAHTVTGTDGTATGTATLTVTSAGVDHLVLSPATSSKGPGVAQAYTAEGFDSFNNDLGDVTGATTFTVATGTCTLADCSSTVAGAHTVTGTDGTATGTATLTVTAGALDHLALTPSTSTQIAGVDETYTAQGRDAFDNSLGDVTADTSFSVVGGTCIANLCRASVKGDHAVTGDDGGKMGTATLTVTHGAATQFNVVALGDPVDLIAGVADPNFDIEALDAYGNKDTDYVGPVHFSTSDPIATGLPADKSITGGDDSNPVTLFTAGTQTVSVSDVGNPLITGSGSVLVIAAAATHFSVTGYPSPATSNVAHNVTVTALDQYGNVDTNYAGTVHFTSNDPGSPTLPSDSTLTSGTGVFPVTLKTQGNRTITATDTVTTSITGSQTGIAIDPGPGAYMVLSPDTASKLAGVAQAYTVHEFDSSDNDLGDFTSLATLAIADGTCDNVAHTCSAVTFGDHTVTATHGLLTDTAILTITDTAPDAVDDTPPAILEDATATTIDVLANDTDVNLDALTVTAVSDPDHGTTAIVGGGTSVTYTPDADWNTTDTFTYTIADGHGNTDTATVTVTITPVNDAPTFTLGPNLSIPEQSGVAPQTVPAFATAITPGGGVDEATQVLTMTASNNASTLFAVQPSVDVNTGNLTYTPAVNRNGVATVTLVLQDNGGLLNGGVNATTHTFTITVTGSNHAPFAINDAYTVVSGNPTVALPVLVNDNAANQDVGEVLHIVNVTQGTKGGTVKITGGGTGLTYKPKSGFIGTDTFTYRVKDASLFSNYATVLIHVPKDTYKPVATAPVQTIPGQTIGSSTIKIRLSWSGTDRGYGISKFELYESINGHSFRKIKTTSGHSAYVTVSRNSSYQFRVRAIDRKGNIGHFAYGPKFKVIRFQESSFVYSVPWTYVSGSQYSGGHARATAGAGQTATITTTGRTFSWVGVRGPTRGTADVYVDGVLRAHLNLHATTTQYRKVIYSITFATSISRTFQIVYTGPTNRRIDVDAFFALR